MPDKNQDTPGDGGSRQAGASPKKPARQPRAPKDQSAKADAPKAESAAEARPARPAGQQKQSGGGARQGGQRAAQRAPTQTAPAQTGPIAKPRLLKRYQEDVIPVLRREFGYSNVMQVPRLRKITLNIGLGEALKNAGAVDAATRDLTQIAGQKPVVTKARMSIANFGLREGQPVGVTVTLRQSRMWHFLDRLVTFALPRVRDFRGLPRNSFDGRGSYTLGLTDQIVFPEIDYNKIDRLRGLQITIVTSARTDEEARRFLELLGVPFVRAAEPVARSAQPVKR
ncbi:MAG: 50S ribosomal protein L5 [SAR202 cluster bacterium]|nr:50S ribosomal protein L5 [SAR202 cluster bacterium]